MTSRRPLRPVAATSAGEPIGHAGDTSEADARPPVADWQRLDDLDRINATLLGRLDVVWWESDALRHNPLGDPHRRPLLIHTPADMGGSAAPSVIVALHGSASDVTCWLDDGLIGLIDRATSVGPHRAITVMPDAWTSTGGSQYLDSPVVGDYLSYITRDLPVALDRHIAGRTAPGRSEPHPRIPARTAVMGHSSGGLGAFHAAVAAPHVYGHLAMLAPDALFEAVHLATALPAQRALRRQHRGDWADYARQPSGDPDLADQWMLSHAYHRGAVPRDGIPQSLLDPGTGTLNLDVLSRWQQHDPVRLVPRHLATLRQLVSIYLSAGTEDPVWSDLGAVALATALRTHGVDFRLAVAQHDHHARHHLGPALAHLLPRIDAG